MNNNPTYQQSMCASCATSLESNTTTTRKQDDNETKTIADDTARRVPQLRFPEFQNAGEWESASFTDLFSLLPNNTLSRAELSTDGEGIYNIHYGDILIKFPSYINVQKTTLPCIKEATKISNISKARLKDGDIVIADTAEDETAGKCIEIGNVKNTAVVAGLHTISCRPNKRFAPAYLGCYMNSHAFHSMLLPIMQGAKVTSISRTALKSVIIYYPSSIEEQQKIADCLLTIDDHIVAITQKLEQLKIQKKALLQKLFPQRGKTTPELRFPEYKNKWQEYTLGGEEGLCEFRNGYTPSKANSAYWTNGIIPWFRMEDIREHGRILSDAIQHITQEAVNGELFEAGSVIISTSATIGEHALLLADSLANQRFTNMKIRKSLKSGIDAYFFYYYCYQIAQWCKYNTNTGGFLSVNMEGLKKYKLYIPKDINEQKKIVECLMSVDSLIDDSERKLKQLLHHKQSLLQQLFPKN